MRPEGLLARLAVGLEVEADGHAEALAGAARFSRALDAAGIPTRGAVACLTANTPETLSAYRGATWSGRRYTPLSGRWQAEDGSGMVPSWQGVQ